MWNNTLVGWFWIKNEDYVGTGIPQCNYAGWWLKWLWIRKFMELIDDIETMDFEIGIYYEKLSHQ